MAKVNLGTAILPKKLNALAQITAKTVIWASNRAAAFLSTGCIEPWALGCRLWHEAAWHGPTRTIRAPGEFDEGLAFQTVRGDGPCNVHRGLCRARPRRKAR